MIPNTYIENFKTMLKAAKYKDLALVECTDVVTKKPVFVICMMNQAKNEDFLPAPIAKMFDGNPYEELIPPAL
jgi:hypothetical protein